MRATRVAVRFDNDTELVIDDIGSKVTPMELALRVGVAIYRVVAGEWEVGAEPIYVNSAEEINA